MSKQPRWEGTLWIRCYPSPGPGPFWLPKGSENVGQKTGTSLEGAGRLVESTPRKTNMTGWKKNMNEDVSLIINCDFPLSCWFSGVYLEPNQIKPPTNSDFSTKGFPKDRIAGP